MRTTGSSPEEKVIKNAGNLTSKKTTEQAVIFSLKTGNLGNQEVSDSLFQFFNNRGHASKQNINTQPKMSTEFSNHFYSNYFYTPHIYLIFGVNMRCHFQKDMWHFLQCVIINYMKSTGRNSGIHLWHYEHVFRDKKYFSKIKQ